MATVLCLQEFPITKIFKGSDNNSSPTNLIKVALHSEADQSDLLSRARNLRNSTNFKKVYINKELTKNESFIEYTLRKERAEKSKGHTHKTKSGRLFSYTKTKDGSPNKPFAWTIITTNGVRKVGEYWLKDEEVEGASLCGN